MNLVMKWLTSTFAVVALVAAAGCVPLLDRVNNEPIEPDPGKRTFGTYIDDERLETIISVNLRKVNSDLAQAHINVESFNNIILLTGEVPSIELKQLAGETARSVDQVRQVHNELLVRPNSTLLSRTRDSWIATKVRTRFLANRDLDSERVKLIVENNIVYLMGLLTRTEADLAGDLAANVAGVEKVVRVVEYVGR